MATPNLALIPSGIKATKVYSVLPNNGDGDFTFDRASTATRINKDGLIESVATDVPRLNYELTNGVAADCPSLLLEPSRTNKINYHIPNSNWVIENGAVVTENYAVSPDGTQNASRIQLDNSGASSLTRIFKNITPDSTADSISFYIKSNTGSAFDISFYLRDQGFGTVRFSNTSLSATTEWSRVTIENQDLSGAAADVMLLFYNTTSDESWDFLLYGVQGEAGSYSTSLIPTDGSTQTRVAETCNGAGTASTFNSTEGVLYAEIASLTGAANNSDRRIVLAKSGDTNNVIRLHYNNTSNTIQFKVRVASTNVCDLTYDLGDSTEYHKICGKYKQNDFALWVDGVEVATDTSGAVFPADTLNTVNFSNANASGDEFYGKVKELRVYNEALTDAQLQTLTT